MEQPPNADYSDAAEQKDSDDHLRFVPEGYQGPAVFKTDTIGLPVIVEQHLGEQDGVRLVKLLLDLPEENLRLHGKYWIGRIKAGASDIAIFENQNGRGPKE